MKLNYAEELALIVCGYIWGNINKSEAELSLSTLQARLKSGEFPEEASCKNADKHRKRGK